MPIARTSIVRSVLTLTCDQCGTIATFQGDEPLATPGWIVIFDPKGERGEIARVCFDTKAHCVTWLKARLDLG